MPKSTSKTSELPKTITVACLFTQNIATPKKLIWHQTVYEIDKLGLHYTLKRGLTLFHVFCVSSKTLNFKLLLDTSSLVWQLEEVYDETLDS